MTTFQDIWPRGQISWKVYKKSQRIKNKVTLEQMPGYKLGISKDSGDFFTLFVLAQDHGLNREDLFLH